MQYFAVSKNIEWLTDWKNEDQIKYGILVYGNEICIRKRRVNNDFVFGIAVKTRKIAEQILDEFGDRIEKYYNQQY